METTSEKATALKSKANKFIESLKLWLNNINKKNTFTNAHDYSKIHHINTYFQSVHFRETDKPNTFCFDIGNLELQIIQNINPISETIKFTTYTIVDDLNSENGIRFDKIPHTEIYLMHGGVKKIDNKQMGHAELIATYLDAIIEYFKEDNSAIAG